METSSKLRHHLTLERIRKSLTMNPINRIYYIMKPVIPRGLLMFLRRRVIAIKKGKYKHIWPIDEKAGVPPLGWSGWPEGKKFALILTHDVETAKGQENCRQLMEMEEKVGFRSSFGFVPKRYAVASELRQDLIERGFEIVVHGLYHDGKYYKSQKIFRRRAHMINQYLREWGCVGFRSPSMQRNLAWLHELEIKYDSSTFDTDPFEPQPDGTGTIFPFFVRGDSEQNQNGYLELPYTLPQDFTLFVLMGEKDISVWKRKLDWIAEQGGMALLITHPDYMNFSEKKSGLEEYPAKYYGEFLRYIKGRYDGQYWHILAKDMPDFWAKNMVEVQGLSKSK